MQLTRRSRGFTLAELAVVVAIIGLLMGGGIMALSAQVEQRNYDETIRRLNTAADAVIAYAIVNGRLPCPAPAGSTGDESPSAGGNCTVWTSGGKPYGGFLPARTIGFQPTDSSGYAVDAWNNRIRYALARTFDPTYCTGSITLPHLTSRNNLKLNGVCWKPNDLDICADAACASRVVSTGTVAFIVLSDGKNGALTGSYGNDEQQNAGGNAMFVSHPPVNTAGANHYDDLMVLVPVGVLYSKLIAAGVLP